MSLELDDVEVRYGTTTAVAGASLAVAAGEVVALLGPSGCGKSSLLRAVAGLEPLTAGRVLWAGEDVSALPVHRRGFGLMFQDGQLFPHRDVAGNVAYGLVMAGAGRAERERRVAELLELVGLAGYGPRGVASLSGGEQQRVALARALAPRPRLLLLDEPLSSLDRSLREHLSTELRDILRAAGTTALYVTHDHDEAFTVATRVAVMDAGHLLQVDTPARLWSRPVSERVARFLGFGPFLPAEVVGAAARTALGDVPRDDTAASGAGGAGRVRVGLGPRALVLDDAGTEVRVTGMRFRRGSAELSVVLPGGQPATALAGTLSEAPETVRVRLEPAGAVVVAA